MRLSSEPHTETGAWKLCVYFKNAPRLAGGRSWDPRKFLESHCMLVVCEPPLCPLTSTEMMPPAQHIVNSAHSLHHNNQKGTRAVELNVSVLPRVYYNAAGEQSCW